MRNSLDGGTTEMNMAESNLSLAGVPMRNRVLVAAGCHGADGDIIVETSKTR